MQASSPNEPVCAFCDSKRLGLVMDFGEVGLAGAFLKPEQFATERTFPMRLHFCRDCYAVQVTDKVPADIMFKEGYFYFSSSIGTLRDHFREYASEVTERFLDPAKATVLEFGCNDGVLLSPLADQGIRTVIGVDPATNVVTTIANSRVKVVNDYFTEDVARKVVADFGKVDLIMANNVYAHIPDIQGTTRAVAAALAPDGVFAFEVHYLGKVIDEMQYDMVYHEHLYYYSLLSVMNHLARYDMMVFDIKPIPIHAGSIRFYTCKKGSRHSASVSPAVTALEAKERARGFDRYETFLQFSNPLPADRDRWSHAPENLRSQGKRIAGYGASGRANTDDSVLRHQPHHLDYMIDDAPAKASSTRRNRISRFFQARSSANRSAGLPADLRLEFLGRNPEEERELSGRGGRMILPLPEVSIFPPPAP